ncbi:hypothetical protein [Mycolicibacterium iranicum]|uniref:LysM domain-containing protein n=1 Tax=Mycolicibacterium iranicum TaxID=912594 RepID=A0A178LS87_MYCIR|nr:hypothetical protein [Mycolicibacterium iranicum]OAN36781.1 hypothetical protein A4X20_06185 [Mycolicibacterium iranicum]
MFLENSRYANVAQAVTTTRDGREVTVVRLRRLPPIDGDPYTVIGTDRLDILAQRRYGDETRYWHVADANTELEAGALTRRAGRVIRVPGQ